MCNSFILLMLCFPFRQIISPACDNKRLQSDIFDKFDMLLDRSHVLRQNSWLALLSFLTRPRKRNTHFYQCQIIWYKTSEAVCMCTILKTTVAKKIGSWRKWEGDYNKANDNRYWFSVGSRQWLRTISTKQDQSWMTGNSKRIVSHLFCESHFQTAMPWLCMIWGTEA